MIENGANDSSRERARRARAILLTCATSAAVLLPILLASPPAQGDGPVCPATSSPDRQGKATKELAAKCIYVNREGTVDRNEIASYNIYCPTRLSMQEATVLGHKIGSGEWPISSGTPVKTDYLRQRPQLYADFVAVSHRFEYGCTLNGRAGVATHLKLTYRGVDPQAADDVARNCYFTGAQNGGLALGARVDREYQCTYRIKAADGQVFAQGVAVKVIGRDLFKQADDLGLKICMLRSTDAQCAPCQYTEKLVARMKIVDKGAPCPSGTYIDIRSYHKPAPPRPLQ